MHVDVEIDHEGLWQQLGMRDTELVQQRRGDAMKAQQGDGVRLLLAGLLPRRRPQTEALEQW